MCFSLLGCLQSKWEQDVSDKRQFNVTLHVHCHLICWRFCDWKWTISLLIQAHILPAMSPKFLQSSAHNHGRQSVSKDKEITILQDGMTVRLVTISVKSSPTLILHEPVIMGESFYSLLPYLCSGYPRLASQELAFYHAYSGGWRNRCGIPWPLPACHLLVGRFSWCI